MLMILIFYAHDLALADRYNRRVKFMAEQMASMIQNISQNRTTNKKITLTDLTLIRNAVSQTIYPGLTVYGVNNSQSYHLGHTTLVYLYCVKGTGHNKCKCLWTWDSDVSLSSPLARKGSVRQCDIGGSAVFYKSTADDSSKVYPSLKIEDGEIKILIDFCLLSGDSYCFSDGKTKLGSVPLSKRLGFYMFHPRPTRNNPNAQMYFHSIVIFTPKPGLFDETPPS